MGGASALAVDRERECPREYGELFRDRYGRVTGEFAGKMQPGERGGGGIGSVDLRNVSGFLGSKVGPKKSSPSLKPRSTRTLGMGEDLNSSMRSVSGTGSIPPTCVCVMPLSTCK